MGLSLAAYANNLYWFEPSSPPTSLTFEINFPENQTWPGLAQIFLNAWGDAGEGFAVAYIVSITDNVTTNNWWNRWWEAPSVVADNYYSVTFAVTAQNAYAEAFVTFLAST